MVSDARLMKRILRYCSLISRNLQFRTLFDLTYEPWLKQHVVRWLVSISVSVGKLSVEFRAEHSCVDWKSLDSFAGISADSNPADIWVAASLTLPELERQLKECK